MHTDTSLRVSKGQLRTMRLLAAVSACIWMAGCSSDTAVLSAVEEVPERNPPAAAVQISVYNDSSDLAEVHVDCYIGDVLVHHSEAILTPVSGDDLNAMMLLAQEEADRVVVTAWISDGPAHVLWSDQKVYLMGADFTDQGSITYRIVPSVPNQAPLVAALLFGNTTAGDVVTLDGSYSSDPDGDPLVFQWQQIGGPAVSLPAADQPITTFVVPDTILQETMLRFRLTVSDGQGSGFVDLGVVVYPRSVAAVAYTMPRAGAGIDTTMTLDGSYRGSLGGPALTCRWQQVNPSSGAPIAL